MRILWIAVVWLAFVSLLSSSSARAEYSAPELVVARYCEADMKGARLSSDSYRKSGVKSIVVGTAPVTTAWDTAALVKRFRLLPSKPVTPQATAAQITVEYSVIGELSVDLAINDHTETFVFDLKRIHGKWKILDPASDLSPHISVETAIRHTKFLMHLEDKGEPGYQRNEDMLKKLKKLQHSQ
jgi:hypothetical protein